VRFRRRRSGSITADVSGAEAALLARGVGDLLELLTTGAPASGAPAPGAGARDPLEALVGLGTDAARPDDPAVLRLFPDAYRPDAFPADMGEREAAADAAAREFRRYTEADLRAGKRQQADVVLQTLGRVAGGGRLELDREQADAWLGTLNDLRLVLGVRLGVTEDLLEQPPGDDDPRAPALHLFAWLGWLQETLLECLEPRAH
jgi:hypothetical protein